MVVADFLAGARKMQKKIGMTVAPIERILKEIANDTLKDNHPKKSGRKKFIRQHATIAFALQWISASCAHGPILFRASVF